MGLSPRQLDDMTMWEFSCAIADWRRFYASAGEEEAAPAMSDERLAELGIVGFG
jgi:hypothetical protein